MLLPTSSDILYGMHSELKGRRKCGGKKMTGKREGVKVRDTAGVGQRTNLAKTRLLPYRHCKTPVACKQEQRTKKNVLKL